MIKPTQKRLTFIFTSLIMLFNIILLVVSFVVMNQTLLASLKSHLDHEIKDEFFSYLKEMPIEAFERIREEKIFQVINNKGEVVAGTYGYKNFMPDMNRDYLTKAVAGRQQFEVVKYRGIRYLIGYFPINEELTGRVGMSLATLMDYERNFIHLAIISLPLLLVVSFFLSRQLVKHAMKPIADVFAFQENFASNVTHELRSPLASLKGNLEVTLRKERSPEEYKETLRLGLKEVDRIVELINNLYMLASSKFRPLEITRKEANLTAIIEEAIESYRSQIEEKKIVLDITDLNPVTCACDESLMRRAIYNLVDNAVKYTPEGGTIKLGLVNKDNCVNLTISNTCESLNREEIKNLFEPFYRGENALSRDVEGKGLGLYITRYIVRSHGGDITIKASEDNMCTIEITHCGKYS